ncbi:MAG: hypothetical protein U1F68_20540 [Gammaproteobacteria bacterium]
MLKAIVGIEVEITRIVVKSKLGQNREERDRVNACPRAGQARRAAISRNAERRRARARLG